MGREAVAKAFADINAAVAVLTAEVSETHAGWSPGADPLHGLAEDCLDILAGVGQSEPRFAALKAQAAAKYASLSSYLCKWFLEVVGPSAVGDG